MKKILAFILVLGIFSLLVQPVRAAISYGSGYYTNLCGSGTAANAQTCNAGCNTSSGSCSSSGDTVVRFECDGRTTDCRSGESGFASSHSIGSVSCGKTVQIDVFTHNCRANGGWSCGDNDLRDYIVWYSGDCAQSTPTPTPTPQPTPTPTPSPTPSPTPTPTPQPTSSCDSLSVTNGNYQQVPAKVTLRARGSDSAGDIQKYRFYFGDGTSQESDSAEVTHTYETSGSFIARADVKDSRGNWKTSGSCETRVKVESSPVESHKSGCSDLYLSKTRDKAPTDVTVKVTGFDNKGDIQAYRVAFGNGETKTQSNNEFTMRYPNSGTYIVRGYIQDSKGNWYGEETSCKKTLYVETEPITRQPETGTSTWLGVLGILSSGASPLLWLAQKRIS